MTTKYPHGREISSHNEYPQKGDLRRMMKENPLPMIPSEMLDPASMVGDEPTNQARAVLNHLNAALIANDPKSVEDCFFPSQAYWKDQLALTYHLRTFTTSAVIASSLLETKSMRGVTEGLAIDGSAQFITATQTIQFIDCGIVFRTASPAATCTGKVVLLPVKSRINDNETIEWRIWVLSTILESLDLQEEDETLLRLPRKQLDGCGDFETDVFIIGGGNAAIALAARLKALGVESVMAEQNARPGDNWALRYDCMRFHVPTSYSDLPYMPYAAEFRHSHLLERDELASHVRRYVESFNLNMITSAQIQSTQYNPSTKRWMIKFQGSTGQHTAVSKHLVLATGIGSRKPNLPSIADSHLYQGLSVHSAQYQNARQLADHGVKSVLLIGSANTAFDVLEDCHAAGLHITMVVRSPTHVVPIEYVTDKRGLGVYDMDVAAADRLYLTLPTCVDSHLTRSMMAMFAAQEPDRYVSLASVGFPVLDSLHPDAVLMHNLIERSGGHYVDVGGTKLLTESKAGIGIKSGVEPVAYTPSGLRLSDGSSIEADAIVWCTGYADKNIRDSAAQTLGDCSLDEDINGSDGDVIGPAAIAARLDATWGIDAEGEIRGLWKRHLRLDNFWVMGGHTQHHRWHSRTLALQIKAAEEGVLPPAYRDTPHLYPNPSKL